MRIPQLNNWAILGILLMFGSSVAEAFGSPIAASGAVILAICAFGMWLYTARRAS